MIVLNLEKTFEVKSSPVLQTPGHYAHSTVSGTVESTEGIIAASWYGHVVLYQIHFHARLVYKPTSFIIHF